MVAVVVEDDDEDDSGSSSLLMLELLNFDVDLRSTDNGILLEVRVRYSPKLFNEYDLDKRPFSEFALKSWREAVVVAEVTSERSKSAYGLTLRGPELFGFSSLPPDSAIIVACSNELFSVDDAVSVEALQLNDLENCLEQELDGWRRYFSKIRSTQDLRSLIGSEGISYKVGWVICFGGGDIGSFVALILSRLFKYSLLVVVSRTRGRMCLYTGGF